MEVSTVLLVRPLRRPAAAIFLVAAACIPLQNATVLPLAPRCHGPAEARRAALGLSPWLWYGLVVIVSGLLSYGVGAERYRSGD